MSLEVLSSVVYFFFGDMGGRPKVGNPGRVWCATPSRNWTLAQLVPKHVHEDRVLVYEMSFGKQMHRAIKHSVQKIVCVSSSRTCHIVRFNIAGIVPQHFRYIAPHPRCHHPINILLQRYCFGTSFIICKNIFSSYL